MIDWSKVSDWSTEPIGEWVYHYRDSPQFILPIATAFHLKGEACPANICNRSE